MINKIQFFSTSKDASKTNFKNLSWFVFLIFLAFIFGNLFGISTKNLNSISSFIFLIIIEFISYLKYSKNIVKENFITNNLNVLKRGFLIGIFIEAFKVGS
jgi:hypothetical protein